MLEGNKEQVVHQRLGAGIVLQELEPWYWLPGGTWDHKGTVPCELNQRKHSCYWQYHYPECGKYK